MPRYYFHLQDGTLEIDDQGTELLDFNAAKIEAVRLLGAVIKDQPDEFWSSSSLKMMVTDEASVLLFALDLSAVQSPLTKHA